MNQNHSIPADSGSTRANTPEEEMMELDEELAYLLHNPKADEMFADLLYSAPATQVTPSTRITDVQTIDVGPPPPAAVVAPPLVADAGAYWRPRGTFDSAGASSSRNVGSTVVDTSLTPVSTTVTPVSMVGQVTGTDNIGWCNISPTAAAGRSSEAAGGDRGSAPMDTPPPPPPPNDRKRKGKEAAVTGCGSEEHICDSTITKRSRIAEVRNRSEKKRRGRINEKMNSLQELIPNCNKVGRVSMLDGAFQHMQSLQLQLNFQLQLMQQLNFIRCGIGPVMFPSVLPYMTTMGMSMEMGINQNQPMMPFSSVPATTAHSAMPAFPMPPVPLPDQSTTEATSQSNPNLPDQPRIPNYVNPYQIPPQHQNGATSNPSSSSGVENPDIHRPG